MHLVLLWGSKSSLGLTLAGHDFAAIHYMALKKFSLNLKNYITIFKRVHLVKLNHGEFHGVKQSYEHINRNAQSKQFSVQWGNKDMQKGDVVC